MPGIVVFKRRWSVGSDDFVVPAVFLLILHTIWLIVLAALYGMVKEDGRASLCWTNLGHHVIGYLILLSGCLVMEACIAVIAMRGTILDTGPRASMQYLLYVRLVLFLAEVVWLILGVVWLVNNYESCTSKSAKEAVLGIVVCNWCVVVSVVITTWCTFDAAGRSWVKMKRYQRSMRDSHSKFQYRRSGNRNRNWRQRKVLRAYQDSWDNRCRFLFCCIGKKDRNNLSFSDIARLLSEFFRDLDVVPSDVVAGLVLLRKYQKEERKRIVFNHKNDVYEFLSGVPITPKTRFLQLSTPEGQAEFTKIVHYMRFALAAYGWPMYLITSSPQNAFKICPLLSCFRCCLGSSGKAAPEVVEDNCCACNAAGLLRMVPSEGVDLIYVTYHVGVGETPFFVALDHSRRAVVICIRGTLSMKDVITDLNAESEQLPLDSVRDDWFGHKGMVSAAEYIRKKLRENNLLGRAFAFDVSRGTSRYDLVLVGHSLGAGTASILAILLKQEHPNLSCFAYSPPGGLLSMPAVEYTKQFITSVVVGKDFVSRIGLHQMEALRSDLISAIQRSTDPKWKTIAGSFRCCGDPSADIDNDVEAERWSSSRAQMRDKASHPSDSSIALTVHQPLFPPGRILHIVRNHPKGESRWCSSAKPIYQGVWVDNKNFDEVLISPCMIHDHMPDKVLEALEKVLETPGPVKPQRKMDSAYIQKESSYVPNESFNNETNFLLSHSATTPVLSSSLKRARTLHSSPSTPLFSADLRCLRQSNSNPLSGESRTLPLKGSTPSHRLLLETSFTCSPFASPGPRPDLRDHINIPGLTWEILSALEDQLLSGGAFTQALSEEFLAYAPLASPETLSETSSIASRVSFLMREASRKSGNHYPAVPSLHHSPVLSFRASKKLGKGYCFYIDATPPRSERKSMITSSTHSSTEDISSPQSASPVSFITLDPILPKEITSNLVYSNNHCQKPLSTSEEDMADAVDPYNHNYFHLLSKDIIKLKTTDLPNPINYQFVPEDEPPSNTPSPQSSSRSASTTSIVTEKEIKMKATSSQSRDSGFAGDRSATFTSTIPLTTSCTTIQIEDDEESEQNFLKQFTTEEQEFLQQQGRRKSHEKSPEQILNWAEGWVTPQQEYGRGSKPPEVPFYLYSSSSVSPSPSDLQQTQYEISPILDFQTQCEDASSHVEFKAQPSDSSSLEKEEETFSPLECQPHRNDSLLEHEPQVKEHKSQEEDDAPLEYFLPYDDASFSSSSLPTTEREESHPLCVATPLLHILSRNNSDERGGSGGANGSSV